jgi:Golgi nucleoside diphosphatase
MVIEVFRKKRTQSYKLHCYNLLDPVTLLRPEHTVNDNVDIAAVRVSL